MAVAGRLVFPGLEQSLMRVLPHGLQHGVACRAVVGAVRGDERLVDEARQRIQHAVLVGSPMGDAGSGFQRPATHENRESSQQLTLPGR